MSHEVVFFLMFPKEKSDQKLSTIFKIGNFSDNLTPDYIKIDTELEAVIVRELKTTVVPETMKFKEMDSKLKYEYCCFERASRIGMMLDFGTYVVSITGSNSKVKEDFPDSHRTFQTALKQACSIKALAYSSGWAYESTSIEEEDLSDFFKSLSMLDLEQENLDPCIITEDLLGRWSSVVPSEAMQTAVNYFEESFKKSKNDLDKTEKQSLIACRERIADYQKLHESHPLTKRKNSMKAPVQLPLFLSKRHDRSSSESRLRYSRFDLSNNSSVESLWTR
jgi:hypothetical protein